MEVAAQKIQNFAFVGLQDFYNLTTCLFHRTFRGPPLLPDAELAKFNLSPKRHGTAHRITNDVRVTSWDERSLGDDFVDVYDERIFAAALDRFIRDLQTVTDKLNDIL